MELPIVNNWKDYYKNKESKRWVFQKEILLDIKKYHNNFGKKNKKAALVKLPTGSGKTAIMAIYSNYIAEKESVLIVVPSEALKRQTKEKLNFLQWEDLGGRPSRIKRSNYFEPSKLNHYFKDDKFKAVSKIPCNYICTHQTLTLLKQQHDLYEHKKNTDSSSGGSTKLTTFEKLTDIISVLFIDEGHREPAKTWSRIVRGFKKPTILFTATPYRNDLRFFKIDSDHIFEVDFQEAVDKYKVIRSVLIEDAQLDYSLEFDTLEKKVELFVKQFLSYFIALAKKSYLVSPKAIIRCENEDEIIAVKKEITKIFADKEYRKKHNLDDFEKFDEPFATSVHDQHTNSNFEFNSYNKPLNCNAKNSIFWIHQYKLMEGIDNYEFIAIGFFSPFQNARSLIQQIGRIIRKPLIEYNYDIKNNVELQTAYVFTDKKFKTSEFWEGYKKFELIEKGKKIYGTEQIVERISRSFPEYFYFDKQFSRVVSSEFTDEEFDKLIVNELQIPKITNVFRLKSEIPIHNILDQLSESLEDNDIIEVKRKPITIKEVTVGLLLGWKIKPTEQLSESIFFNISFESYAIFISNGYLFFRGNINLSDYLQNGIIEQIEPELFSTLLLSDDGKIFLKQLSVLNSDPSLGAIRRKIEGGNNLTNMAPSINDHLQVLTTAMGVVNKIPRYVGITRSRISDNRGSFVSTEEYIDWITHIINSLRKNKSKTVPFLNRFAAYVNAPQECIPCHILFDLTTFSANYENVENGELISEDFFESSTEIYWDSKKRIGKFNLLLEEKPFELNIRYINNRFKITIAKEEAKKIKDTYKPIIGATQGPVAFIKNSGIFRILTKDDLFYAENNFFNPSIKLWGNGRFENIGLFYSIEELSNVEQEKEITKNYNYSNEFQEKTIFHLIDRLKEEESAKKLFELSEGFEAFFPEYLICDDQSNELGDFIAFSEKEKKVVVIHAKIGTKKTDNTNSAVSFENVGDQVVKNLRSFDPYNFTAKDFHDNWDQYWTSNKKKKVKRIRRNKDNLTKIDIKNKLIALLKKDVTKEVWVMYGKGFKKSKLLHEFEKEDPIFNIKHLAYSIANYNEAVTRHGARLKIFVQP